MITKNADALPAAREKGYSKLIQESECPNSFSWSIFPGLTSSQNPVSAQTKYSTYLIWKEENLSALIILLKK